MRSTSAAVQTRLWPDAAVYAIKESDEAYTPKWIFDAMGATFDLDVASPGPGRTHVPAKRHLTLREDGLASEWHGLVWCNPPFSAAAAWARKWALYPDGVLLAPFSKSTWITDVLASAHRVCVPGDFDYVGQHGQRVAISYACFIAGRGDGAALVERIPGAILDPRR